VFSSVDVDSSLNRWRRGPRIMFTQPLREHLSWSTFTS